MASLGALSFVGGCKTTGEWTETDTQKLAATLEYAGFVLAVKLGKDSEKREYLELAANSLEIAIADGKLDPTDILSIILANVKNDDIVIGISGALTIYNIWWNDTSPSTTQGVVIIAALVKGLRDGLSVQKVQRTTTSVMKSSVHTFKSKSLNNAVKSFFQKY